MRYLALILWTVGLQAQPADPGAALDAVARVATAMVDGDVAKSIETPRSKSFATRPDPRDPWVANDNYDVNAEPFIRTKKTLMRLATLCDRACDLNLWMPLESDRSKVQIVIRNINELSQFWNWGDLNQPMPAEMAKVIANGKRITVRRKPGTVSVLAPVYDSLGDAVGVVEVVSRITPDPRENVK